MNQIIVECQRGNSTHAVAWYQLGARSDALILDFGTLHGGDFVAHSRESILLCDHPELDGLFRWYGEMGVWNLDILSALLQPIMPEEDVLDPVEVGWIDEIFSGDDEAVINLTCLTDDDLDYSYARVLDFLVTIGMLRQQHAIPCDQTLNALGLSQALYQEIVRRKAARGLGALDTEPDGMTA
ncbi:MAG: hypothetical protein HZC41_25005 [Chloroflexi bacterium]|nr:hypothetical protein [Chloroflexota bacterium]